MRQTSIDAFRIITESGMLKKLKLEIYVYLFKEGPKTAKEVFLALSNGYQNSGVFTTRLSELRATGVVQEVGEAIDPRTKCKAILWDVTPRLPEKQKKDKLSLLLEKGEKLDRELEKVKEEIKKYVGELV